LKILLSSAYDGIAKISLQTTKARSSCLAVKGGYQQNL